ncbi:MAG: hemerythrin domain-containing protein [Gammaproteobacteria bacterium]|nr:hemerythrin domain-containing protein [Gammaproteobacteria bacterium]
MKNNRHDIYQDIHKGIRRELCDWVGRLGRLDAGGLGEVKQVRDSFSRFAELLRLHAHHEELHVHPLLNSVDERIVVNLEKDHEVLDKSFSEIETLFDRLIEANQDDSWQIQQLLYSHYSLFCSQYLQHMSDEETLAMPMLQANFSDQELMALTMQIRQSLPPETMGEFLKIMIPAMHIEERVSLFKGLQEGAPEEIYQGVCQLAGSVLDTPEWLAVQGRLS